MKSRIRKKDLLFREKTTRLFPVRDRALKEWNRLEEELKLIWVFLIYGSYKGVGGISLLRFGMKEFFVRLFWASLDWDLFYVLNCE